MVCPIQRKFMSPNMTLVLLRLFVTALCSRLTFAMQNYLFTYAAAVLTARLRSLSFKGILRQDSEYYDSEFKKLSSELIIHV